MSNESFSSKKIGHIQTADKKKGDKTMKIIVKESNKEKLNAAIRSAEGRATARTITADIIIRSAERITRNIGIPKKYMIGITAYVDYHAQDFPNAYKYTPESTQFNMIYTPSGWAVCSIERWKTHRANQAVNITLTEEAKEEIIKQISVMRSCEL